MDSVNNVNNSKIAKTQNVIINKNLQMLIIVKGKQNKNKHYMFRAKTCQKNRLFLKTVTTKLEMECTEHYTWFWILIEILHTLKIHGAWIEILHTSVNPNVHIINILTTPNPMVWLAWYTVDAW